MALPGRNRPGTPSAASKLLSYSRLFVLHPLRMRCSLPALSLAWPPKRARVTKWKK